MVRTTETTMPPGYTLGDFVNKHEEWPNVDEYTIKLYFVNPKTKDKWGFSLRFDDFDMHGTHHTFSPPKVLPSLLVEGTEKVFRNTDIFKFPVHTIYEDWDEVSLPGVVNPVIKYRKQTLYRALMCEII